MQLFENAGPAPAGLHFTEWEVDSHGSLAHHFQTIETRCGIYRLDFADGSSYVGQSVAATTRVSTHRRRWGDIVRLSFAECPLAELDQRELDMIRHVERSSPLRNKMLAGRPGGHRPLIVTVAKGQSLSLPWTRADRPRDSLHEVAPIEGRSTTRKEHAFAELAGNVAYPKLRGILGKLLNEAFPAPARTQDVLWTITALPSTNRNSRWRRLLTLNAGRLEILRVFEEHTPDGILNLSALNLSTTTSARQLDQVLRRSKVNGAHRIDEYSRQTKVRTVELDSLDDLERILRQPVVLDGVYDLVVTMMRQGNNALRRHHNFRLAEDILSVASADATTSR